jgi:ethanolamine utilization protein EutN
MPSREVFPLILCHVTGNAVATTKNDHLKGYKMLVVQPFNVREEQEGSSFIALDVVDAGAGDTVLVVKEGGSARMILNDEHIPVQAVVVGVVDEVDICDAYRE